MKKQILLVISVLLLMLVSNAKATVIDFEILGAGGDKGPTYLGTSVYNEDGFVLSTGSEFGFIKKSSIVLFSQYRGDLISLSKIDGEIFDLLSIDFYPYFPPPEPIEFTAVKNDNTTVQAFFPAYEGSSITLNFDNFTNIISVSWHSSGGYDMFDNISLIPEPTTISLILLGGVLMRRNRR